MFFMLNAVFFYKAVETFGGCTATHVTVQPLIRAVSGFLRDLTWHLFLVFFCPCRPFYTIQSLAKMPQPSKQKKSRQINAQKAFQARQATFKVVSDADPPFSHPRGSPAASEPTSSHVQTCSGHPHQLHDGDDIWDFDLGDELPDLDCDNLLAGSQEADLDEEIVVAPEISDEKDLDVFSQFLFDAQAAAQKAERARTLSTRSLPLKNSWNLEVIFVTSIQSIIAS
jgi:hypothetical protein